VVIYCRLLNLVKNLPDILQTLITLSLALILTGVLSGIGVANGKSSTNICDTTLYSRGQGRNENTRFITPNYCRNNGRKRPVLALDLIAEDIKVYQRTGHR
jgi:hypothetical protein